MPPQFRDPAINQIDIEGRGFGEVQGFEASNLLLRFFASGASDGAPRVSGRPGEMKNRVHLRWPRRAWSCCRQLLANIRNQIEGGQAGQLKSGFTARRDLRLVLYRINRI
jgi:hypothetical protein